MSLLELVENVGVSGDKLAHLLGGWTLGLELGGLLLLMVGHLLELLGEHAAKGLA